MIEEAIECYKSAIQATSSTSTLDFTNHVTFDSEQYNAKTVLLNNLAASFAIQTDYEKAGKQLQHITELIPSDLISQKEHLNLLPGHFTYKVGCVFPTVVASCGPNHHREDALTLFLK